MEKVRKAKQPQETKERALDFYIMGLTALQVEKLTGIPKRTLERYMMNENWKDKRKEFLAQKSQKISEKQKEIDELRLKAAKKAMRYYVLGLEIWEISLITGIDTEKIGRIRIAKKWDDEKRQYEQMQRMEIIKNYKEATRDIDYKSK